MERPNIVFYGEVNSSESPFSVEVDLDMYANLLDEVGLDKTRISGHTLWLNSSGAHYGIADPIENDVEINVDKHWKEYEEAFEEATKIAAGTSEVTKRIDELLYTNRLPDYLKRAPSKRGLAFAKKLLLFGMNRELRSTLLHEAKHFDEPRLLTDWLNFLGSWNPFEIRAQRFAVENESETRWRSLIEVSPEDRR